MLCGGRTRPGSPESPTQSKMKGMSAHPDDKDVSFEELMEQYRQYEVLI